MIAFIFHPLFVLFLSIILFTVIFRFSARYSAQNIQVYKDFSIAEQGDWCSRYVIIRSDYLLRIIII
jgi:hypothetical protein